MEPLRFGESKMIHTVKDGIEIGEKSGKNNVLGLADLYHVYGNDDKLEEISSFNESEMGKFLSLLLPFVPNAQLRGV